MNEIVSAVLDHLPPSKKTTASGWISFDAVCCHHRGESRDTRARGGLLVNQASGGFQYHCFNCQFKAGWTPGHLLSANTRSFMRWLGLSDDDITKLGLIVLRERDDLPRAKKSLDMTLERVDLPEGSKPLGDWIQQTNAHDTKIAEVADYLMGRGFDALDDHFYWTPAVGFADRVLIPFWHNYQTVGYTARKITDGKPKYLAHSQSSMVFNLERQTHELKSVIVVEGIFDAIVTGGVAVMTNNVNDRQAARINALGKNVIVVPDRDRPGAGLVDAAIQHGWSVSMPPWPDHIKDAAEAAKKYGRLYTMYSIMRYQENNQTKIKMLRQQWEKRFDRQA